MRVTANTFPNSLLAQLNDLATRQNRLQTEAATGQKVISPEDDPIAMRRVLDLQGESKSISQYQRNIQRHQQIATVTSDSLKALKKISDRAGEIVTLADGLKSPDELQAYSKEVGELLKQAVQIANTKNGTDYIFAGTRTSQPPFAAVTATNGDVTAVNYQGNQNVPESEIAEGVTFTAQIPGANSTGDGATGLITDSRSGADFFNHLIALQNHLSAGDTKSISNSDRASLAKDEDNLILHMGTNGALQARLETTAAAGSQRQLSVEKLVSNEADADLAQTIVRLHQTQNAYQAALQTGGALLNHSLLDYLR